MASSSVLNALTQHHHLRVNSQIVDTNVSSPIMKPTNATWADILLKLLLILLRKPLALKNVDRCSHFSEKSQELRLLAYSSSYEKKSTMLFKHSTSRKPERA
jgi:hypothetical protein